MGPSSREEVQPAVRQRRHSRPRFALLVLIGVYPIITALLYVILPLTEDWTIWQRTIVLAPVMVATMVWGLIPQIHARFGAFLNPLVDPRDR